MFTKQRPQHQSTRQAVSQRKESHASVALEDKRAPTVQRQPNKTGLPDNLKSGMENLSGMSLDNVRVHYNSAKPAAVQAHAYAQGSDIHLASGQEKHLPHELGHVVQQAQGRVSATTSVAGMAVNDSPALEHEADVLGGEAIQLMGLESNTRHEKLNSYSISEHNILQGYFINGMVRGTEQEMMDKFLAVKTDVISLGNKESEFNKFNKDAEDHGQLFDYLVSRAEGAQKALIPASALKAGVIKSQFSAALNTVGTELTSPKKPSLRLDLNAIKTQEFKSEAKGGVPVSPRHRSRLLQIPNLVALITELFSKNNLLKDFDFILGGGAALTLKLPSEGRLGRPSENMRDIDMDFQVKDSPSSIYTTERKKGLHWLIVKVKDEMSKEMEKLAGRSGALLTGEPSITMGTTIIFKSYDLEYSFHFIDKESEKKLGSYKMESPDAGEFSVIDDESHWLMTMSALTSRLSRPDKIHKTLVDALVLAGDSEERLDDISYIITEKAMKIVDAKRALKGLYLDRKSSIPIPGIIDGLDPAVAKTASSTLESIKSSILGINYLTDDEIRSVRSKYLGTVTVILKDISSKASTEKREKVKSNSDKVISKMQEFRVWIRGYEHYVKIPD